MRARQPDDACSEREHGEVDREREARESRIEATCCYRALLTLRCEMRHRALELRVDFSANKNGDAGEKEPKLNNDDRSE